MRKLILASLFVIGMGMVCARSAGAVALAGDPAPNFTKDQLDSPSPGLTTPRSLTDYRGKVVILFELGYN